MTERFNQTLSRCLAKVIDDDQCNWDEKIDTVLMGYRASKQASIKQSPYFMLYQQHMRLPIDAESYSNEPFDDGFFPSHDRINEEEETELNSSISNLLRSREEAFKKAQKNILSAQKCQKK